MKRVALFLSLLFIGTAFATGDKITTSKTYVDTQLATKQEKITAIDTNTVITTTNTDGEIGEKAIYDTTAAYDTQQDALVTAADANAAIQNAIDTEFICTEWAPNAEHTDDNCYIWDIQNVSTVNLPSGYTRLQYLESTGTQYLNLGRPIGSGENITTKFEYTVDKVGVWFGARAGNSYSAGFVFEFAQYANNLFILSQKTTVTSYHGYQANGLSFMTPYILNWYGNPFQKPTLSPTKTFNNSGNNINESNYLITPPYNAFLFAYNMAGTVSGKKPMRIYYFTVEGKMNLIPARRNSDGKLGMYDTISNAFLTNAGTGEFIGPNFLPTEN